MDHLDLESLIARCRAGDEHAYAALVRAFYPLVFGVALAGVSSRQAAEDVAQDAFVAAWTHLDRLRNPAAFPGWLRKITRNLALAHGRSEQYRKRLRKRFQQEHEAAPPAREGHMEHLAREERRRQMLAAVQQLSPRVREAVVLFYLEERSVAEAARLLGLRESSFKVRLHLGRRKLREHFARQGEDALREAMRPPSVQDQASRVMAGLAAGPALAPLADAAAKAGWTLAWHELMHQGSLVERVTTGGMAVGGKKAIIAGAVTIAALLGVTMMVLREQPQSVSRATAPTAPQALQALAHFQRQQDMEDKGTTRTPHQTDPEVLPENADKTISEPRETSDAENEIASTYELERAETGKIEDPREYAAILGLVIDSKGRPVAGATVRAIIYPDFGTTPSPAAYFEAMLAGQHPGRTFTAQADALGAYAIRNIAYEGNVRVAATAEGFYHDRENAGRGLSLTKGQQVENVTLTLEPGITLHGRVLSQENEPVPDAVVQVVGYSSRAGNESGTLDLTTTDARGEFKLGFVRKGSATLVVSSGSHGKSTFNDVPGGEERMVDLQLTAPATIHGQVRYANGEAAPGVEVHLTGSPFRGDGGSDAPGSVFLALTDDGGEYRIEKVDPAQEYRARVHAREGEALNAPELLPRVNAGEDLRWDCTLENAILATGTVRGTPSGRPLRNVKVAALRDGMPVEDADAPVDAAGAYELRLLSGPGNYLIYPRLWRIEPETTGYDHGVEIELRAGEQREIDLQFPDPFTMSVRVVDGAGNPMPGVMTAIRDGDHTWMPAGETDADGRFVWGGFMPGVESQIVLFQNRARVGASDAITGEAGMVYPEQTVTLFGEGGLEGIAMDGVGTPLANGLLILTISPPDGAPFERQAPTDSQGHFLLSDSVPATSLQVKFDGYTEGAEGIHRYSAPAASISVEPELIVDLGYIVFSLEETDVQIE